MARTVDRANAIDEHYGRQKIGIYMLGIVENLDATQCCISEAFDVHLRCAHYLSRYSRLSLPIRRLILMM